MTKRDDIQARVRAENFTAEVDQQVKPSDQQLEQLRFINILPQKDIFGIADLLNKSLTPFRDITADEYKQATANYTTSIYREVSKNKAKYKTALLINHPRPEQGLAIPFEGELDAGRWAKMEQDLDVLSYYAYSNGQTTINAKLKDIMKSSPRYEKGIKPEQLKSFTQSLELAKSITVTQAVAVSELKHKADYVKGKKVYAKDKNGKLITHDIRVLNGVFLYKTYRGKPVAIDRLYNGKLLEEFRLYGMRAVASSKGLLRIIAEQSPQQYRLAKAILARFTNNAKNTVSYTPLVWDRDYLIEVAGYQALNSSNTTQANIKLAHTLNMLVTHGVIDKWHDQKTKKTQIKPASLIAIYPLKEVADSLVLPEASQLLEIADKDLKARRKKALVSIMPKGKLLGATGKTDLLKELAITDDEYDQLITSRLELTDEQITLIEGLL